MLKISNMKWKYKEFTNLAVLIKVMNEKFKAMSITAKMSLSPEANAIAFSDVVDGKTFISSVDNVIKLKAGDPRVKKIGRDYLLSKRPTEEQYKGFFEIIQSTIDLVGLEADVELIIPRTSESILLRRGLDKFERYPKMKSFPHKAVKGEVV